MSVVEMPPLASRPLLTTATELVDGLPDTIVWEADAATLDFLYVSQGTERVLGYPPSAWYEERPNFWVNHLHPEDRDRCVQFCRNETAQGRDHEFEYRMLRADGSFVWVRDRAYCVRDTRGKVVKLRGMIVDITAAKERAVAVANERVRGVEQMYSEILTAAGIGIYGLDCNGVTTFANPAAATALGYTVEELVGRPQHALIHHSHADGSSHPAECCPIHASLRHGITQQIDSDVFFKKDGTPMPVEYVATPIRDGDHITGAVVTFRDVTDKLRAVERERELVVAKAARRETDVAREQLTRLFDQTPAVIAFYRGPDHVIELVNPLYQRVTGDRDVIGKPFREAFPELDPQLLAILDQVYSTGQPFVGNELPVRLEQRGADVAETTYWNFVWQPILDDAGATEGVFVHAVEVTGLIAARREVERRAAELLQLTRALERSNRDLDQFAYVASHDLKAPLRGISNLSQWIEEDVGDRLGPEVADQLRLMRGRVRRMEALIDGILAYSRAGRVAQKLDQVDVGKLLRDLIDMLQPANPGARIEIGAGMPKVQAERVPLQQVFMNLIGNALKHAERPDPVVRVEVTDESSAWHFRVIDNGPGIAPEFHDRIWGIFQTLESRDEVEGTGIGLSIVKKIVETRGGSTWVESAPGAGATFHVEWPKELQPV